MSVCSKCGSTLVDSAKFCPSCGVAVEASDVRGSSAESPGSNSSLRKTWIILGTLLATGLIAFLVYINPSAHPVIKNQPFVSEPVEPDTGFILSKPVALKDEGEFLAIPLSEIVANRLVRFEYATPTTMRAVIAYVTPEGRIVTAMSVSEHCGSTEFKLKGSHIYCARCPSHWDMTTMEAYACCGKYYPDPIPSEVSGDKVRIRKSVVENWAGRL